MEKLSVVIITLNEEKNIERCLLSVSWADEIVVVDSGSTDRTVEICRNLGGRVIKTAWQGFGPTKRFAVQQARYDWILSIDADEQVTPALRAKIQTLLQNPDPQIAYRIKRFPYYLGHRIRYCGWQNDYPLRLFNRHFGNFNTKPVHEGVEFNGSVRYLQEGLNHFTYPTLSDHIRKMNRYSELSLQDRPQGKKVGVLGAIGRGWFKFFKMYVLNGGFLDGSMGFVLCVNSAFGVYLKYLKQWERQRS